MWFSELVTSECYGYTHIIIIIAVLVIIIDPSGRLVQRNNTIDSIEGITVLASPLHLNPGRCTSSFLLDIQSLEECK